MQRTFFLLLMIAVAAVAPARGELSAEEKKLVGEWQFEEKDAQITARQVFRENGTYTAELRKAGELTRKFEGIWRIEDDKLVYTYTSDSLEQIPAGAIERDHIVSISENSYTIEAGDHLHRTYFRVKESR